MAERREERRRARPRRGRGSGKHAPSRGLRPILILLVIGALLGVGGYSVLRNVILSRLVGIVVAREGQVEETVRGQGFVIRHETLLRSPVSGTVTLTLGEAERARSGAEVANLSDTEEKKHAEERVTRLQADLDAYNSSHQAEEAALVEELVAARGEAGLEADELRAACLGNDFPRVESVTASLAALGKREEAAAARLKTIRSERAALEESLATAKVALAQSVFPVTAPVAGIVSYCLDGLEETLTPENIGQYGTRQVLTMEGKAVVTVDRSRVRAGDPVAKVIRDSEAFVSVIVTNSQADLLAGVRQVTLRFLKFEGRRETPAALFHVGEREKNGYTLVTYVAQELLEGMVTARQVDTTVVVHTYSGTVLPRKALVRRGGEEGVFVLEKTEVHFRPVAVKGGNDEEVVVEGLPPNTPVISTPWFVKEGMRIGEGGDRNAPARHQG